MGSFILNLLFFLSFIVLFSCTENKVVIPEQEKDFCSIIHLNDSISLSEELESVNDLMETKTGV